MKSPKVADHTKSPLRVARTMAPAAGHATMTICGAERGNGMMMPPGYYVSGNVPQASWFAPPLPEIMPTNRDFDNVPVLCTADGFATAAFHADMVEQVCLIPLRKVYPDGPLLLITDHPPRAKRRTLCNAARSTTAS
eukprot:m.503881 g.503881  ORF g.503881 m.503881 type:complete len:137 (+) comp72905_c0_seq1:96-506(+)